MRIGIFDSGLGGLVIAKAIFKKLPKYDYVYLGDTKNLPYGQKSAIQIRRLTEKAVDFLFKKNCQLIIIACNTSSAWALRKIQQKYLPKKHPSRRVLGVIIPTLETADSNHKRKNIGVIGTTATISSHIYKKELRKIDKQSKIYELATPHLVPLIEQDSLQKAAKTLKSYIDPLKKRGIEALVLACTHYPILKRSVKTILGKKIAIISQDEIIPEKLASYLKKHLEIEAKLTKHRGREFLVTSKTKNFGTVAKRLFGRNIDFKLANYLS
jgi:glutamate racemase